MKPYACPKCGPIQHSDANDHAACERDELTQIASEALTEADEYKRAATDLRAAYLKASEERNEARAEVARLKEIIAAKPPENGKALRVEMSTTPEGRPCLIVTAPIH